MSLTTLIEALATAQATADADRTGGSLHHVPAITVEIVDTRRDPATAYTVAWFVFDFVVLHSAQSGSDWYHHHVLAGRATLVDDQLGDSTLVRLREANVTEFVMEWAPTNERYDHDHVRGLDRDAWWSTMSADPLLRRAVSSGPTESEPS